MPCFIHAVPVTSLGCERQRLVASASPATFAACSHVHLAALLRWSSWRFELLQTSTQPQRKYATYSIRNAQDSCPRGVGGCGPRRGGDLNHGDGVSGASCCRRRHRRRRRPLHRPRRRRRLPMGACAVTAAVRCSTRALPFLPRDSLHRALSSNVRGHSGEPRKRDAGGGGGQGGRLTTRRT